MIDLGIMNDFADYKKLAIFENFSRRIGEINRALDSVAETKLLRQAHRCVTYRDDPTGAAHFVDDVATIVGFDLLLHGGHYIGRAQINLLARRRAARNQIRAHGFGQRNRNRPFSNGRLSAESPYPQAITDRPAEGREGP
jgi:hypothetical protein